MTVERVKYFPGERLDAADLRLDQNYHIMVRRLVNRGFFSPGVVEGLTVTTSNPTHVTVAAGFALDPQGREIVLTRHQKIATPNKLASPRALGYYLTIRYGESTAMGPGPDCAPDGGAPSRIQEVPQLGWTELWPDHRRCPGDVDTVSPECAIVLALVTLDPSNCHVRSVDTTAREQAHSTLPGQVKSFQIEGEKDIAPQNGKRIHFNIRGAVASSVILQLWSGRFSNLYYTELPSHQHLLDLSSGSTSKEDSPIKIGHTHPINNQLTELTIPPTLHRHSAKIIGPFVSGGAIAWTPNFFTDEVDEVISMAAVDHRHFIVFQDTKNSSLTVAPSHKHALSGISTSTKIAGNTGPVFDPTKPLPARDGLPEYSYIDSLTVKLDGHSITDLLIKPGWGTLGNGTANHGFVKDSEGTGPVRLPNVTPGAHTIDLIAGPANGGKVMWNLTVE